MIVVVEGATASGKTTWCRSHAPQVTLPESLGHLAAVDGDADPEGWARFWHNSNVERWRRALELESRAGLAVCDTDPFKLHYTWCLWRIGQATQEQWEYETALFRDAFARDDLGLADLIFFAEVDEAALRARRGSDATRMRRRFDLHVRLAGPLRHWYEAVARLEPARVVWELPASGVGEAHRALGVRRPRTGAALFDRLLEALPG